MVREAPELDREQAVSYFDRAFGIVVGVEAGYVNDPKDPGGETKYGISKAQYPDLKIADITLEQAKAIYLRDYWNAHDLDSLEWGKALLVFDCAVNGGNHQRWYSMYGGYALKDFIPAFQAERLLFLAADSRWPNFGRGWGRRVVDMAIAAAQP